MALEFPSWGGGRVKGRELCGRWGTGLFYTSCKWEISDPGRLAEEGGGCLFNACLGEHLENGYLLYVTLTLWGYSPEGSIALVYILKLTLTHKRANA